MLHCSQNEMQWLEESYTRENETHGVGDQVRSVVSNKQHSEHHSTASGVIHINWTGRMRLFNSEENTLIAIRSAESRNV
jgi:hypothetical protein